jgi:predicted ATP-grasp superfamily ATP-dependent carboligase
VLETLRNEVGKNGEKPVVIACADNLSSLLDMHYDEFSQHYALPGAKEQGRITRLMDKEVMSELAADVGLLVPSSVATDTSLDEKITVPLPWIIKPLVSKNGVKADIERIYTPEEWADYKSRHQARVQVQQLIEKEFEYQLIGLSLNGGEEVIIPGVSHVIRPQSNTNTGFLRYEPLSNDYAESVGYTKRFLKETGYSGLFSMEFLRGKDGKDYFMEINFRNDGNAICVTAAGVNLPYLWYQSQTGQEKALDTVAKSVYVMPEFDDFRLIKQGKNTFAQWLKDIRRTERFMEFDNKDQKPFWSLLFKSIMRKL